MQLIIEHQKKYPLYFKKAHSTLNYKACEIELFNLWVNFQKKYEFNPFHMHDGLYSFVLWHKVPYKIDDEKARLVGMKDDDKRAVRSGASGKKVRTGTGGRVRTGKRRSGSVFQR